MQTDVEKLRDQAAKPVLRRIGADGDRVSKRLKPLLDLVAEKLFHQGFDVNTLWRETGLRKGTASPRFAKELSVTPGVYLTDCRMQVAAALLAGTELNIKDIAEVVGYDKDNGTFSMGFKAWSGQLPSAYRLAHGGKSGLDRDNWTRLGQSGEITHLIEQVEEAHATDDIDSARHSLAQIDTICRDRKIEDLSARLALEIHQRGAQLARNGDVDQAFDQLTFAALCYGEAGDLPPEVVEGRRKLAIEPDTRQALMAALCTDCAASLNGEQGRGMRQHLRRALQLVPRDLPWFEICCDECYRVVWRAISRARIGLMDNAWQAWWLSVNADLEDRQTPPSRGRFIAALAQVEQLVVGDQLERKIYCDLALSDAIALGDSMLEAEARIWRGNVLRALGQFDDGREELGKTAEVSRLSPWLAALRERMVGILENNTNHRRKALDLFRSATARYEALDPHLGGLLLTQQGNVHFFLAEYESSIEINEIALSFLDSRRDPWSGFGVVPISLAISFTLLGHWAKAEAALARCRFDKEANLGVAATELFTRSCMELLRGQPRESLRLFDEAKQCFEKLHRPLDVALAASYSVEAYARLGDRAGAIENAVAALSFFQAAGCAQDSLEALGRLQALLEAEVVDVMSVTAHVRRLARQHGGWLPEPGTT